LRKINNRLGLIRHGVYPELSRRVPRSNWRGSLWTHSQSPHWGNRSAQCKLCEAL